MPILHELSRTAAALGTAVALVVLPLVGTVAAPAVAQATAINGDATVASITVPSVENPLGTPDGELPSPEPGPADPTPSDPPTTQPDPSCASPAPLDPPLAEGQPCRTTAPIDATWRSGDHGTTGTMTLPVKSKANGSDAVGTMPDSWVGQRFSGPVNGCSPSDEASSPPADGTDDSGNSVPATAGTTSGDYTLNAKGQVVRNVDDAQPVRFAAPADTTEPTWTFTSERVMDSNDQPTDQSRIVVCGTPLTEADSGSDANKSANASNHKDANAASESTTSAGSDGSSSSGTASSGANTDSSAGASDSASADTSSAGTADGSNSAAVDGSATAGTTTANSSSTDSANTTASGTTTSVADASGTTAANSSADASATASGMSTASGASASANADGGADGAKTTPDPSTGNGSADIRNVIPGDVGPDWLPGGGDDSRQPDYSDPVPRNPDTKAPEDDTDLITGGSTPSPRSDSSGDLDSFSESITSTIASSWPVLVLAALGMAAVGFIIFLVGKRKKQG